MLIESRLDSEDKKYIVGQRTENACNIIDTEQEGCKEYGNGTKMYLFTAMGYCQPFALDVIHADSKEEAEEIVQVRYGKQLQNNTLIRQQKELIELVDERN